MLSKEQLQQLKTQAQQGGEAYVEFTFPNLFDHVQLRGNTLHLRSQEVVKKLPETIDVDYKEVEQLKLKQ